MPKYEYSLVVRWHGDPVLGPLAGEVDAHARHDGRRVAQAHRRQVQAVNKARAIEFCRQKRICSRSSRGSDRALAGKLLWYRKLEILNNSRNIAYFNNFSSNFWQIDLIFISKFWQTWLCRLEVVQFEYFTYTIPCNKMLTLEKVAHKRFHM